MQTIKNFIKTLENSLAIVILLLMAFLPTFMVFSRLIGINGISATTLIVWGEKLPFFTRTLETAGNYFTEGIMRTLDVDYKTAEEMKFKKGIDVVEDKEETSSDIGIALEKKTVFNGSACSHRN